MVFFGLAGRNAKSALMVLGALAAVGPMDLFKIGRENGLPVPPAEPLRLGDDEVLFPFKAISVAVRAGRDLGRQDGLAAVADLIAAGVANNLVGSL